MWKKVKNVCVNIKNGKLHKEAKPNKIMRRNVKKASDVKKTNNLRSTVV